MRLFLPIALMMTAVGANLVLNRAAVGGGLVGAVDFALVGLASASASSPAVSP